VYTLRPYLTALGLLAVVATLHAQSPYAAAGVPAAGQVEAFLSELQRASREDDRRALAALIQYPATVTIGGLRIPFADASALIERVDAIFTPAMRSIISRAAASDAPARPDRNPILVTADGLVVGPSALTIQLVDGRLRITAIVVPHVDPADAPAAPPSGLPTRRPRRLAVRVGPRARVVSGSVVAGATDVYIAWANKGQRMEVRLARVPTGAAALRVVHVVKGTPLDAAVSDNPRVVSGRVIDSGDYRIEVHRLGSDEVTPLPYTLSVTVR
jgi:hypothetical protein